MIFPAVMTMIGINFPHVQPNDAFRLIHSPEKWAAGAGLMLGVGRFALRDVRGPTCYGKECMVHFDAMGKHFCLIAKEKDKCTLMVTDDVSTTIVAKVIPLKKGCRLVLTIEGHTDEHLHCYYSALKAGLWPCVMTDNLTDELDGLKLYRQKLDL
jgi:hypothetical protein